MSHRTGLFRFTMLSGFSDASADRVFTNLRQANPPEGFICADADTALPQLLPPRIPEPSPDPGRQSPRKRQDFKTFRRQIYAHSRRLHHTLFPCPEPEKAFHRIPFIQASSSSVKTAFAISVCCSLISSMSAPICAASPHARMQIEPL